jgi:hypothetical protein
VKSTVCLRSTKKAYLFGTISGIAAPYHVALKAVNCQTEETLANSERDAATRNAVGAAVGDAGNELRSHLGESLASVKKFDKTLCAFVRQKPVTSRFHPSFWPP